MKKMFSGALLMILIIAAFSCNKENKEKPLISQAPDSFKVTDIQYGTSIPEGVPDNCIASSMCIVAQYTNNASTPVAVSGKWYFEDKTIEEVRGEELSSRGVNQEWRSWLISHPFPKSGVFKLKVEVKAAFSNNPITSRFEKQISLIK